MSKVLAWVGGFVLVVVLAGLCFNCWTEAKKDQNIFKYFQTKIEKKKDDNVADVEETENTIETENLVVSWEV